MAAFYTFDTESKKLIAEKIYYDQSSALGQMQGNQTATAAPRISIPQGVMITKFSFIIEPLWCVVWVWFPARPRPWPREPCRLS
jgi:hypothetical protein